MVLYKSVTYLLTNLKRTTVIVAPPRLETFLRPISRKQNIVSFELACLYFNEYLSCTPNFRCIVSYYKEISFRTGKNTDEKDKYTGSSFIPWQNASFGSRLFTSLRPTRGIPFPSVFTSDSHNQFQMSSKDKLLPDSLSYPLVPNPMCPDSVHTYFLLLTYLLTYLYNRWIDIYDNYRDNQKPLWYQQ